jgi:hypothetical protein
MVGSSTVKEVALSSPAPDTRTTRLQWIDACCARLRVRAGSIEDYRVHWRLNEKMSTTQRLLGQGQPATSSRDCAG